MPARRFSVSRLPRWTTFFVAAIVVGILAGVASAVVYRTASHNYHQAAVGDVSRIQSAQGLSADLQRAQSALQQYTVTLDPTPLRDYSAASQALVAGLAKTRAANGGISDVAASIGRFERLVPSWQRRAAQAIRVAQVGRQRQALSLAKSAAVALEREDAHLMQLLASRRTDAIRAGDRWGTASLVIALVGIALAVSALGVASARIWRSPLRA